MFEACSSRLELGYLAGKISEQLQNTPLKSKLGEGPRVYASSFFGGWIKERGNFMNFLCVGHASTRGYASNLRLRVPVFVVFCHGGCIIDRGNFLCAGYASTRGYASNLRLRVPVFVLFCGSKNEAIS